MRKKISRSISIMISAILILSLFSGCGQSGDKDYSDKIEYKVTTEEYKTEAPIGGVDDPAQQIDDGALLPSDSTTEHDDDWYAKDVIGMGDDEDEEPATTAPTSQGNTSGKYSYTIYDGAVTINMDVNVDDYIMTDSAGEEAFELYKIAYDYGWMAYDKYTIDTNEFDTYGADRWTHHDGDMVTRLDYGYDEDTGQLNTIIIQYYKEGGDITDSYYELDDSNIFHREMYCVITDHRSECNYDLIGQGYFMSYDDIVLFSYIIYSAATNPGENPLTIALGEGSVYNTWSGDGAYKFELP